MHVYVSLDFTLIINVIIYFEVVCPNHAFKAIDRDLILDNRQGACNCGLKPNFGCRQRKRAACWQYEMCECICYVTLCQ